MDALVLPIVRLANLANLLVCAVLIGTGTIQFNNNIYYYSIDKWHQTETVEPLANAQPFMPINVDWQYVALAIVIIFCIHLCTQLVLRLAGVEVSQRIAVASAFISAPVMLAVFYWEMHYGRCPWLDHYRPTTVAQEDVPLCTATAWIVAAALSVISCCLFLIDGLLSVNINQTQRRLSVGYVDPVVRIYDSLHY